MPRRLPGGFARGQPGGYFSGLARGLLPAGWADERPGGISEVSNWLFHYFQQFFSILFSSDDDILRTFLSVLFRWIYSYMVHVSPELSESTDSTKVRPSLTYWWSRKTKAVSFRLRWTPEAFRGTPLFPLFFTCGLPAPTYLRLGRLTCDLATTAFPATFLRLSCDLAFLLFSCSVAASLLLFSCGIAATFYFFVS